MKAQDFLAWMDATGNTSALAVAGALGMARETARAMVSDAKAGNDVHPKRAVQLAMTALANNLRPWGDYDR